jgi:hypothetical protein
MRKQHQVGFHMLCGNRPGCALVAGLPLCTQEDMPPNRRHCSDELIEATLQDTSAGQPGDAMKRCANAMIRRYP